MNTLELRRTTSENEEFLALIELLDAELSFRDGDEHEFFAQFNKPAGLAGVVVAYDAGMPVGCGAFKKYSYETAEIKRMFVRLENRGQRIGTAVLSELEMWAAELGFRECILETGFNHPEAISLYKREGYEIIPNYDQYADVKSSVCMRKRLDSQ